MSKDVEAPAASVRAVLGAHDGVRELVRLLQCRQCSRPYKNPVTLPCGNSLCRTCLPETYQREHISYPDLPGRRKALQCPFEECGLEHALGDCNVDVTLTKIMDAIEEVAAKYPALPGVGPQTTIEELQRFDEVHDSETVTEIKQHVHQMSGGTLLATYGLAMQGLLDHQANIKYLLSEEDKSAIEVLDTEAAVEVLGAAQREVECQVCYGLMINPITTYCGHTLCRLCLTRVLDHTLHCPICRRGLALSPALTNQPNNKTLMTLIARSWPDLVAARLESIAAEESHLDGQTYPLFVCTLGFPTQPTFMRIFEPRYRLMLRRCIEGSRQFGLVMYNRYSEPQGDLGNVHFYHYGTMVRIVEAQMFANGTSMVELFGLYRFRVMTHGILDGYSVGTIERIDDVDLAEEERIEAEETSLPTAEGEENDLQQRIDRMPTKDLLAMTRDFVARNSARNSWLRQHVLDSHGQPPEDAATFPWWFASVAPVADDERYKLLSTRTVRARLKIVAHWVRRIEAQRWYYNSNACRIL